MTTKIEAAEIATYCGGVALIANGADASTLERVFAGRANGNGVCTGDADERKATVAGVCGGSSRASSGGCGRTTGNYGGESEFAEFGGGPRGTRIFADGCGEYQTIWTDGNSRGGLRRAAAEERNAEGKQRGGTGVFTRENIVVLEAAG